MIYCIVPRDSAPQTVGVLKDWLTPSRGVDVLTDRREGERRRGDGRRAREVGAIEERRKIANSGGRRIADRRAEHLEVPAPRLPRRFRRDSEGVLFFERLEPSARDLEDVHTRRLVTELQARDMDRFDAVYMRYFDRLYGYLRLAMRNAPDAEAALEQTFLIARRRLGSFGRSEGDFLAWLFRITRAVAVEHLQNRVEPRQPVPARASVSSVEDADLRALDWLADAELLILMERLPVDARQVLALRFMLGLATEEIGEILGADSAQVLVHQDEGLNALRGRLLALGRQPERRDSPMSMRRLQRYGQPQVRRMHGFDLLVPRHA